MDNLKITSLNRRAFLAASSAGAFSTAIIRELNIPRALAKENLKGDKSAAWYRFKIGDMEATVVSDGFLGPYALAAVFYPQVPKADVDALVLGEFLSPEQFVIHENCLVLNTGDQLALIDTGRGAYAQVGEGGGRLTKNLEAAGVKPEDIDVVILSHAHLDHVSGIKARGASGSSPTLKLRSRRLNSISGPTTGKYRRQAS
jgi:hypothetical protein